MEAPTPLLTTSMNCADLPFLAPAYHAEEYSPDDNRFDLRPFLYPPFFESWSFKKIDERVEQIEKKKEKTGSK